MHNVSSSISNWATTAAIYSTRTMTAVGVPTYLALRMLPNLPLKIPGNRAITATLVSLSAPSTLTCGLGAAEGVVRTIIKLFDYCIHCRADKDTAARKWDQFVKEGTTVHGLIRGTLSPISGYTIIVDQWKLKEADSKNGIPRTLTTEYYVYRALLAIGRGVKKTAKLVVRFFKWAGVQIVWGLGKVWEGASYAARAVWNFIQPALVKLWEGIFFVARKLQSFAIAAGNVLKSVAKWLLIKAVDGVVAAWNVTQPLRSGIRYLVWDLFLKEFVGNLVLYKIIYKIILKKVIWKFGVKFLLNNIVWKPIKFAWNWAVWPGLQFLGNVTLGILTFAYNLSVWATQHASRLIGR